MFKAVIFDFDGVIADSEPLHCEAILQILKLNGVEISEDEYYSDYLGYSDLECFQAVYRSRQLPLSKELANRLIHDKSHIFEKLAESKNTIIDGVPAFIKMLAGNRIPVAVCSGALLSDIELMLKGTGLENAFEVIVTADDVVKGKPDPQGYLLTLQRLNEIHELSAAQCVVIEDSIWGLNAAESAGMKTIGVTNTYPPDKIRDSSDLVVESLAELTMEDLAELCS